MITKQINLYEFKELDPKIQEKVLNKFREVEEFNYLSDTLTDYLTEKLKTAGYEFDWKNIKLYYSLSYCQGDGLMFEGKLFKEGLTYVIKHSGNYYHSNSKDIDCLNEEGEFLDYTAFNEFYVNLCKETAKYGYDLMEEDLKDENIKEMIEANEYYFREDGTLENKDQRGV